MLHPVIPYACRGMIWYQGEANAALPQEYAQSLPLWVKRLRTGWKRDDFHFLCVMLPGYGKDDGSPTAKSWARFREVQLRIWNCLAPVSSTPLTWETQGTFIRLTRRRSADAADGTKDVHGLDVVAWGPLYEGHSIRGNEVLVRFSHAGGLKTCDGKAPAGFWLADEERAWRPATALVAGETVVLKADGIVRPAACRYAFCGKPEVNLVNGANLPAYPFRTDDWDE